jgi:hypothetical protein
MELGWNMIQINIFIMDNGKIISNKEEELSNKKMEMLK